MLPRFMRIHPVKTNDRRMNWPVQVEVVSKTSLQAAMATIRHN